MESSEPFKHEEADESVIRNFSVLDTSGDLTPAPDGLSPYNRYTDEEGKAFYALFDKPKMQFVVSELASLAVPVAPILLRKKMPEGNRMDFSAGVEQHPDFGKEKSIFEIDQAFLYFIFSDPDHYQNFNNSEGIQYDFGVAKVKFPDDQKDYSLDFFKRKHSSLVPELVKRITDFKKRIEGDEGLEFIKAVVKKADYSEVSPEVIQNTLIKNCDYTLSKL